ncbi:ATPase [Halovulum sp. GXIMD14794]
MMYHTAEDWLEAPRKRVALFGMSGLGKTFISNMLRDGGEWFHYSVDFRIGTRYMGEHIVDNFKREAMRNPFLRELLMSDSIYIASNITFQNLSPLSTYLGKPGDPDKGGIPFEEYVRRQRQHREAEISATLDALTFAGKAEQIYGYPHFVCDSSGSLCEVVDPHDPEDPVLRQLSAEILPIWIRGTEAHVEALVQRFDRAPKPMYYQEDFLRRIWDEYRTAKGVAETQVDPDDFIRWGFRRLVDHRLPIYEAIARNWGITVEAEDVAALASPHDFERLVARTLSSRQKTSI